MPAIFEHTQPVLPSDIDGIGHVNNLVFVRWLQDAAVAHSAAQGWPGSAYHQLGKGWVVRSHFVEYLGPAFENDLITVRTWVSEMKRATSARRYHIFRGPDRILIGRAETQWAFVSFSSLMPCRVPDEVTQAFEVVAE